MHTNFFKKTLYLILCINASNTLFTVQENPGQRQNKDQKKYHSVVGPIVCASLAVTCLTLLVTTIVDAHAREFKEWHGYQCASKDNNSWQCIHDSENPQWGCVKSEYDNERLYCWPWKDILKGKSKPDIIAKLASSQKQPYKKIRSRIQNRQ